MLRSLHTKLVLIMILQVVCLMTIAGAFLINSVNRFYLNEFYNQMVEVFSKDTEFVRDLVTPGEGETDGVQAIDQILVTKMGPLGVDGKNRNYYILDGGDGSILTSSDDEAGQTLDEVTPNLLIALNEKREGTESDFTANYMDLALPITRGDSDYIIYILDQRAYVRELNSQLFQLIIEALAFGLIISVLLSFLLSRAMVNPIRALTRGVKRVADGDFSREIHSESHDEIGVLTGTFNDMARQLKETLEEVENERNKLGTLFLHMTDGVVAFSRDGVVIQSNPAAETLLGRAIPIGGAENYDTLFSDIAPLQGVLAVEQPGYLDGTRDVDGRSLELLLTPFDQERLGGVLVVIHDVTERRRSEQMQREFVANVSHELRTPLTNIRSYAETIRDAGDELPRELENSFLDIVINESDRMTHIVQDLLTLSRLDSGRSEMNMARFDFGAAIDSVLRSIELEARRHGHELTHDYHDLPMIMGDRGRIEQVMLNVLGNAVKYTPDGGHIRVTAGTVGERVWMEVADDGIGIPKADRSRIFERFYRVDKARSRESGGTGLGLSIATEIVQRHNGTLSLVDREGPGTTVRLELPIRQSEVGGAQEGGNG